MLKFGICSLEDYRPEPSGFSEKLRAFFSRNRFSYQLLRTPIPANPREIAIFEQIMQQMRLNSGVYRTTYRGRFQDLDRFVNGLLASRFDTSAPLKAQDWAASDCLTSAEWAPSLFNLFPQAALQASDLTLNLIEVRLPSGEAFILEAGLEPLQYITPPLVIRLNPPEPKSLTVNWLLGIHAQRKLARLRPSLTIPEDWLASSETELRQSAYTLRKIPVVHPEAVGLSAREPRFTIERHSAFETLETPVDVIRSMNIFNLVYFSRERLTEGIRAVWASLKPGGYWIVGRTYTEAPPAHNVSVLEKQVDGFRLIDRIGEGSEIESLVLGSEALAPVPEVPL